jgi:methylase of polypeptide subunit release factors
VEPTPEGARRARALLARHGYLEAALCTRLGIPTIAAFEPPAEGRDPGREPDDAQGLLVDLFLEGRAVPWARARALLDGDELAALVATGLVREAAGDPTCCASPVLLYPVDGLWIASDRAAQDDDLAPPPPLDVVYPAIAEGTREFMRLLPRSPCGDFLELCAGTGIAALVAARDFARRSWAVDVTARATRFAHFNAALNALDVAALQGDLWAPLAGHRFDRIAAHPPYVPSAETSYVFRDGGEDGERVTFRIVEGAPAHLAPGGLLYCRCAATDRRDAPLEARVRAALGRAGDECDVVVGETAAMDAAAHLARLAEAGVMSAGAVEQRRAMVESLGIERVVMGAIVVRRREDGRAGETTRRVVPAGTDGWVVEGWLG